MWKDSVILGSLFFIVPWSNFLEGKTYVSDMLSVKVILLVGVISLLLKYFLYKEKPEFSYMGILIVLLIEFMGKGIIVFWLVLSLNFYLRGYSSRTVAVNKEVEDNYRSGTKGRRSVIISNPNKMIDVGEDYSEYGYIQVYLSKGFLGIDVIEHYDLKY